MSSNLALRLAAAREALKLTQEEFFTRTGLPVSTLKKYEGSHREPKASQLALVLKAGININWLLTGEGSMFLAGSGSVAGEPDRAAYGAALPPIDSVLLQGVIDFFYAWLDENKDLVRIDRDRHGTVIAVLYRVAAQSGEVRRPELEQVLQLAA